MNPHEFDVPTVTVMETRWYELYMDLIILQNHELS